MVVGGREEWAGLRSCHTRKGGNCPVLLAKTVRRAKVSTKHIQPSRLHDKRVPFLQAPPQLV